MGVGGPAPPAGFPPTHCRRRPRRCCRELFGPSAGAGGYLETGTTVEARYRPLLLIAEAPPPLPSNEVAYTAGLLRRRLCEHRAGPQAKASVPYAGAHLTEHGLASTRRL